MEKQRTIRVTGKGTLKLRPDLTRLTLTLQGTDADYGAALKRSADDTETLRTVLESLGFARDALKTQMFNVDAVYEGYQDEKGVYRNRFTGYQFQHALKLEFPIDDKLLGRTLYALAHSGVAAEFHIGFTVLDTETPKNELLSLSVKDARAKAETLAEAAGLALGSVQSIDYSWDQLNMEIRPMRKMALAADFAQENASGYDMNITPDDITVSDTVTVTWEIGG